MFQLLSLPFDQGLSVLNFPLRLVFSWFYFLLGSTNFLTILMCRIYSFSDANSHTNQVRDMTIIIHSFDVFELFIFAIWLRTSFWIFLGVQDFCDFNFYDYLDNVFQKVKLQKYWTPRKIQNGKSLIKWQNQKHKHIKRMDNNCHIPHLVQAYSYVKNGTLNLVLKLAQTHICLTVASNSIIDYVTARNRL